ncbi:hypothetical protein [Micromonospora noduli]|uniref:hypothetical protein n=1 Tax=Micromonospora noduli TaxID=709876 RepID=UPI0011BE5184|nr:hypothetical protein [Micromonospora noduli]
MRFTLNGSPAAALAGQITDLTVQCGLVPARVEPEHSRVPTLYALLADVTTPSRMTTRFCTSMQMRS